jgi:hypothetical protein
VAIALSLALATPTAVQGDCCNYTSISGPSHRVTDDFHFHASSAEGAVGDVVGIELAMSIDTLHGDPDSITLVAAYDAALAELLGEPDYSDEFDAAASLPIFMDSACDAGLGAFVLASGVHRSFGKLALEAGPVSLGTVYFRLHGEPGASFEVRFADDVFGTHPQANSVCVPNEMSYPDPLTVYSRVHFPGTVRIRAGEPTQTEPPPLPPEAKVYPAGEEAEVHFELEGGIVVPGSTLVPVRLMMASDHEFVGYLAAGRFPKDYVELVRIENHHRIGTFHVDNERGEFWAHATNSRRRMAAEGERIHAATLYLNIREAASEVDELRIGLETILERGARTNSVYIRRYQSVVGNPSEVDTVAVEPLQVADAILAIRRSAEARLGDVNFDESVDITDAVAVLSFLFQGADAPLCLSAGDYNRDGGINLSDPIAILGELFLGQAGGEGLPERVPCAPFTP